MNSTDKPRTKRPSAAPGQGSPRPQNTAKTITLPKPAEIKAFLDKYVIGQEDAKKVLSVAVYNHYKRIINNSMMASDVSVDKSNVMLIGDTGCGKTFMVKTIAKFLDVPCYVQDCTKITESGYVGSDVEECLVGLLRDCDYNIEKAQCGIVVLDECDKLSKLEAGPSVTRDVGGVGVQQSLLKIVEGDTVGVPPMGGRKHPEQPLLYVDTTNILFIASGAFVGLSDIVGKRLGRTGKIGFNENSASFDKKDNPLQYIIPQDLRTYGMIPEFVGRFPVITNVNPLSTEDLVEILTEPKDSLVRQYTKMLSFDGISLSFTHDALMEMAKLAKDIGTGARGLRSIMETVMMDTMFEAPSWKAGTKFSVTKQIVLDRTANKFPRNNN